MLVEMKRCYICSKRVWPWQGRYPNRRIFPNKPSGGAHWHCYMEIAVTKLIELRHDHTGLK